MGFLSGFKNKDKVESKEEIKETNNELYISDQDIKFAKDVVRLVNEIADGKVTNDELTREDAMQCIEIGYIDEELLKYLHRFVVTGYTDVQGVDINNKSDIAVELINACDLSGNGREYPGKLLYANGVLNGRAVRVCKNFYNTALDMIKENGRHKEMSAKKEETDSFKVTDKILSDMRNKLANDKEFTKGLIGFTWNRMPSSLKKGEDKVRAILDYLQYL